MGEIGEWSRESKETRNDKRRADDWLIVSGTCYYAKNRSSLTTYDRIGKIVQHGAHTIYVAEIGRVDLEPCSDPARHRRTNPPHLNQQCLAHSDADCNRFNATLGHSRHGSEFRVGEHFYGSTKKVSRYGTRSGSAVCRGWSLLGIRGGVVYKSELLLCA
ncbi:hypothetical protein BDV06DRAFT_65485 [Aspergillus oleicola]